MKTQAFMVSLVILVCSGLIQQMIQQAMSFGAKMASGFDASSTRLHGKNG